MSIHHLPNGTWRVQIRRRHIQHDQVYQTKAEAKRIEDELLKRKAPEKAQTLSKLVERYHDSREFSSKAEETQKTERSRIKHVLRVLGNYTLSELEANISVIHDYMDARAKQKSPKTKKLVGNTSIRLEMAALSAIVAFGKTRKLVQGNFVSNISRPTTKPRKRRIQPMEQGKLALAARRADPQISQAARFLMLIRHLGCRPGELKRLKIKDIRLQKQELTFFDTKNGTDRNVHATKDARELIQLQLEAVAEDCPYLFGTWSKYKKEWVPYGYAVGLQRLKEAGVAEESLHAHAGRREYISRAIEAGLPLTTIKKQTGHKSTQALEDYDQGLSTAPEVRHALDTLAGSVKQETLLGAFESLGMNESQREKLLGLLGESGWHEPFPKAKAG